MTERSDGRRLDVLFIGDVPPLRAGSAISPFQVLVGLAGLGHRVRAIGPVTREKRDEGLAIVRGQPADVHWIELPEFAIVRDVVPEEETARLYRERFRDGAAALIEAHAPDVLICGHEYWTQYVVPLVRKYSLPSVQLIRGNPGRGIVDGTFPAQEAESLLADLREFDTVVAVADYLAEGLRLRGVPRSVSIPNVVDSERFRPRPRSPKILRKLTIRPGQIVVAHFSNFKPIKRALDIVEAAPLVLERIPDVMFLMVGDGIQRDELEAKGAELSVHDHFRYPGWVDYEHVPDLMNLADIIVMPSSGEGMSRVYLEAQACGRVLIASAIPPARQIVDHRETGLLFETANHRDLADNIIMASLDSDLRSAIGTAAREQVEQRHTLVRAVDAYESVMFEALAHHAL